MNGKQLYLNPDEAKFLAMAVLGQIETIEDTSKNERNWNPEARKDLKDILNAGKALKVKMQSIGIDMRNLPSYNEGDEDEFLTKQS